MADYKCTKCGKELTSFNSLMSHYSSSHPKTTNSTVGSAGSSAVNTAKDIISSVWGSATGGVNTGTAVGKTIPKNFTGTNPGTLPAGSPTNGTGGRGTNIVPQTPSESPRNQKLRTLAGMTMTEDARDFIQNQIMKGNTSSVNDLRTFYNNMDNDGDNVINRNDLTAGSWRNTVPSQGGTGNRGTNNGHNNTGVGNGDNGGNDNAGTSNIDNRTQTQKEMDFYSATQRAIDDAKAGNPETLRNFDKFFNITRPEEEYTAEFYNRSAGDIPVTGTTLVEPTGWSEKEYLAKNPDVAAAVERGDISSGLAHYFSSGKAEGRQSDFTPAGWNEKEYLKMYPDVAAAVEKGDLPSGLAHYFSSGKDEGRKSDFGGSIPTTSGVGVLPPSIDPVPPQRGSVDDSLISNPTRDVEAPVKDANKLNPDGPSTPKDEDKVYVGQPVSSNGGNHIRNDKDSGFAYPWSAAKATGTTDVQGTIGKAVEFMNKHEGKNYKYDSIKGTIQAEDGSFISKNDVQSLNNIITKYHKTNFELPESAGAGITAQTAGSSITAQSANLTYGGVGTAQKPNLGNDRSQRPFMPSVVDVTNGAVKIDGGMKDGSYNVGSGGFAGNTPGVKTHPIEGTFNLP